MLVQENVPLAPLTTFRIGGPARFLIEATRRKPCKRHSGSRDPATCHCSCWEEAATWLCPTRVGPESYCMLPSLELKGFRVRGMAKLRSKLVPESRGIALVDVAVSANCAGVECLSGIPGSVGGTPVQNVGAYGQEVSNTIESVQVFDLQDNQIREFCAEACGFEYRSSIFNTTERGRFVILRVTYALIPAGSPFVEYADLKRHFEGQANLTEPCGNSRGRAPDSRAQGHADCRRRSRLPQRRFLLQESACV